MSDEWKIWCEQCKEFTDTTMANPSEDKENGWKAKNDDCSWKSSCRGIRSEYWTVKCKVCGNVRTYDFSRD